MPVHSVGTSKQIGAFDANQARQPRGLRGTFLLDTHGHGVPRFEDLATARILEQTHTLHLPIDTILAQVTTTPWTVRPTDEDAPQEVWDAAEEVEAWLDGGFNANNQAFNHFLKEWVRDILSIDAGVVELVPDKCGTLREMYVRDGATFTKNPDRHDRLPPPGDTESPAWYQFGLRTGQRVSRSKPVRELASRQAITMSFQYQQDPTPFARDQIVWAEQNPRSYHTYGQGLVQVCQDLTELILNQVDVNQRYFDKNEIPNGLISLLETSQDEVKAFREWWTDEVQGNPHAAPIINKDAKWVPFRPALEELQFLESQEWFNKLTWMVFGLNQNEVGDIADVNRATANTQELTVFRRTTSPLLDLAEGEINQNIIPHLEPVIELGDPDLLEFVFEPDNPRVRQIEREMQENDLTHGIRTINEIRRERGLEEVPWGDMPQKVVDSAARNHPEWALEEWGDVEDPPEATGGMGLFASGHPDHGRGQDAEARALRDDEDARQDAPTQVKHVRALERAVRRRVEAELDAVLDQVEDEWPRQNTGSPEEKGPLSFDVSNLVATIDLADALHEDVMRHAGEAMRDAVEEEGEDLAQRLEEEMGDDAPRLGFQAFDVQDTQAFRHLEREAAKRMRHVEDTVKDKVRGILTDVADEGGSVSQATQRLRDRAPEISDNRARLVSRTETLNASRTGSQALADTSPVIWGKRWNSTGDARTRPWHDDMDGVEIPKDESFTVPGGYQGDPYYQPSDYPREAFVVGDDQPFNCRCIQQAVLDDDVSARSLAHCPLFKRVNPPDYADAESRRQREVLFQHGRPGESVTELLARMDETRSRNKAAQHLGVSKRTYYDWLSSRGLR